MRSLNRPSFDKFDFPFVLGLFLSLLSVAHMPTRLFVGAFDRNAAPQFIVLCLTALFASIYLLLRRRVLITPLAGYALLTLVAAVSISLFLSDSPTTSLIGDTGRYSGFASLISFVAIALAATHISSLEFRSALLGACVGIVLVTTLGFLQSMSVIDLPTGGGVGSTLGNLDFLSAWVGTTLLLVILVFREYSMHWLFTALYIALSIFVLWKIGAKQGYLDLVLVALFVGIYQISARTKIVKLAPRVWKVCATFFILLWSEAIFLIPMAKIPFPGVSTDVQVSIRADFWYSASHMFAQHIGFGVGPDNYGSYYEKFRSLHSVKSTEFVLANDAHSSMLQTFATLGIFATLIFVLLILAVIYSAIDLYAVTHNSRYLILLLAFFIFYTNALISPIPLPNKAFFWLIAGFLIGENMRQKMQTSRRILSVPAVIPASLISLVVVVALTIFVPPFMRLNTALASNHSGEKISYEPSDSLPCIVYAHMQLNLVDKSGGDVKSAAQVIDRNHPRCLESLSYLAEDALSKNDYPSAKRYIYQLLDVAPARQYVVRLAAIYAMKAGDDNLKNILTSQGLKLGILTETQLR